MVDLRIRYEGELHCAATHEPSGAVLATDAPADNQGRGESFSPTDLLATALGTCMATVMGIAAAKNGWSLDGLALHVKKHMTAAPPRRVARLAVVLTLPSADHLDAQARALLERTANECPVRLSLLPAIEVPIEYRWDG